jgi:hypothetical protein
MHDSIGWGPTLAETLARIRSEFLEMPGLCLTADQARRLWGLDPLVCEALLAALVDAQFLVRTPDGGFARAERSLRRRRLAG